MIGSFSLPQTSTTVVALRVPLRTEKSRRTELQKRCKTPIPNLLQTFQTNAEKHSYLEKNQVLSWAPFANTKIQDIIDEALKRGRPAAANYQISFMMRNKVADMHWSSIVGRKVIGGVCHYQIRDSFGEDCRRYKEPKKCSRGYIWVPRDKLINHSSSAEFLE